jgi:hypothetical protein
MINKDLTIIKSVKQYKTLKNNIYKWEAPLKLSNVALILVGLFFFVVSALEIMFNTIPLIVFFSVLTVNDTSI